MLTMPLSRCLYQKLYPFSVLFCYHLYSGINFGKLITDCQRLVGASIINNKCFPICIGLRKDAGKTFPYILFSIVSWKNNTQLFIHFYVSPPSNSSIYLSAFRCSNSNTYKQKKIHHCFFHLLTL